MPDVAVTMTAILGTLLAIIYGLMQVQVPRTTPMSSHKQDNTANTSAIWPDPVTEPSKLFYEQFVAIYTPIWITLFGAIVVTQAYQHFDGWAYLYVCGGLALPLLLQPFVYPGKTDGQRPWYQRYSFKANLWLAIYSFIGNYFYTHYFYSVLHARYTMPGVHRLNNVPIAMFFATHFYFSTYHWFSNVILRYIDTKFEPYTLARRVLWITTVLAFSYFTAFMETLSISSFPYWEFADRGMAYKIGSAFYGIYFIVSFPAFYEFDRHIDYASSSDSDSSNSRGKVPLSVWDTIVQACGYGMIILIILDLVRISLGIPLVMDIAK